MISGVIVGLLAALGAGTWLYTKFMRRTGGNTKSALIASGVLALIVFIFVWSLMSIFEDIL